MKDILDQIDTFNPENGDFTGLEILLEKLVNTGSPATGMINLFNVLERFYEESEPRVFWEIMDELEEMEGFEQELVNSLKRQCSAIGIMELNMIYNSGAMMVGNEKIKDLLNYIKENPNTPESTVVYIKESFEF